MVLLLTTRPTYYEADPWFWNEIETRKKDGGNVVALAIGLPNWGKSWWCLRLCEEMHEKWGLSRFTGDGIVFNALQFWQRMNNSEEFSWTLWDEPNKGLSHRDWYEEMNRAVTTYLQTFRFKKKNLMLALPHDRLVDKSARSVLIFRAKMLRPGLATIEQIIPDYYGKKEYFTYGRGEVELYRPSKKLIYEYDLKKEEFHKLDFPEESFTDEKAEREKSWQAIKRTVLGDPDRKLQDGRYAFKRETGKGTGVFVFSARAISAVLDCSDNTARRVIDKIGMEQNS